MLETERGAVIQVEDLQSGTLLLRITEGATKDGICIEMAAVEAAALALTLNSMAMKWVPAEAMDEIASGQWPAVEQGVCVYERNELIPIR